MEYRMLGNTGLSVSSIGLGTWSMGGRWWGEVDDRNSIRTIDKALDLGINFIDTADLYGFGHSETVLGKALGSRRKDVILATKVGLRWNNKGKIRNDLSKGYILQEIDASLRRLQTEVIDLYQIHWPDPRIAPEETMEALNKCVSAGKVKYLGASNCTVAQLSEYRKFGDVITLQPPLNLIERATEVELLPHCFKENLGVLVYSPLCRGLLTGKFTADSDLHEPVRKRDALFNPPAFERNIRIVTKLEHLALEQGKTVGQLAIAWVLAHDGVTVALSGARQPEQIEESVGGSGWSLDHETMQKIEQIMTET